jgi:hypothetical protein
VGGLLWACVAGGGHAAWDAALAWRERQREAALAVDDVHTRAPPPATSTTGGGAAAAHHNASNVRGTGAGPSDRESDGRGEWDWLPIRWGAAAEAARLARLQKRLAEVEEALGVHNSGEGVNGVRRDGTGDVPVPARSIRSGGSGDALM